MRDGCPFCEYDGPSPVLARGREDIYPYIVIEPLDPVTEGHRLVVPQRHFADFREQPECLAAMMLVATDIAPRDHGCNLIVSAGSEATQTVPHVHVHVVPRRAGDGLKLPWSE